MKTSRQIIFEFIQIHRVVTAADIGQAFQMTRANARHHLNILLKQGLIEIMGHLPASGKGRPANLYAVSNSSLGNNLPLLLEALLLNLKNTLTKDNYDIFLHHMTANFLDKIYEGGCTNSKSDQNKNLTQRLFKTIQILNQHNFYARWEAHSLAPRIILDHCPYLAIIDNNPEICQVDKYLIEELVEDKVVQTSKLIKDFRGVPHCIFQIIGSTIF